MNQIGTFIRKLREEKNMSIRQLAKYTGVSPAYISQIENNYRKNPTQHILRSLADGLGIEYHEFLLQINELSKTAVGEQKFFYEQYIESSTDSGRKHKQLTNKKNDLYDILLEEKALYYKGTLLDDADKKKIQVMIRTLLE